MELYKYSDSFYKNIPNNKTSKMEHSSMNREATLSVWVVPEKGEKYL